ncbi:MAG TPA: rRNA pseudouridine synthase [Candidatus Coprovivens excrementavium]|nr:rRNA pseudouridine synthase [Candidatus Coprovivens excrementavium]
MERLQKVISNAGYCSRRKAEELILKGKVFVNGNLVKELGVKVSNDDIIVVEGVTLNKKSNKEYYLLNKPRGVICSVKDEKGRKVVTDLIDTSERIYPVGRLDYDTTGVLLLTNDGDFANILMHPSNEIEKTYLAVIEGIMTTEEIYKLKEGIIIDGEKIVPKRVKVKKKELNKNKEKVEITIVEGKNHIVKKLFKAVGHPVAKLTRERLAFLDVKGLQSGEYRLLTSSEVKRLKQLKKK